MAADGDTTTQPKSVKVGGVELEIKRFPLSRYQANNEESDSRIKGAFVGLTNVTFSFAGNIVRVVDAGLDTLYNLQPIDKFADSMTNVSKTVYKTLKSNFGEALFIFVGGYIVYLFAVRGSAKEAMRRSVLFICVLIIGGLWMSNAGYYMKALNALSVEAQGKLLVAGNGFVGMVKDEGNYVDNSKIEKGKEMEGAVAIMRNVYFNLTLKKPYLIVNYDETSERKIKDKSGDEKGGLNRIDKLLSYKLSKDGEEEKLKYIKNTEIKKYGNDTMTSGNVYNQLGQSIIAVLVAIVLGIPFLGLAFFNFLLQIIALAIVFFIPFAFMISYVPQLAYSGFVTLGRLGSVFLLKAMLGIITLFVYVMCFVVDQLIPPNGFGMYLLNVVVLSAILWVGFKKRDSIIKFVTAGKVVSIDNNMMENVRKEMVQPSWETAKKGANTLGSGVSNMFSHFGKSFRNRSGDVASNDGVSKDVFAGREFGIGGDAVTVSRTPQKVETFNNYKTIDRKPQYLLKKDQQQQSLSQGDVYHPDRKKGFRHEGTKVPVVDTVLKNVLYEVMRSTNLQEKIGENDRIDQKEFSQIDQFENRSNGFKRKDYSETQIVRLQTDGQGTDSKKSQFIQEKVGEVNRTVQVISSDDNESVNTDSVKNRRKTTKLVQGNQMKNHSDGVFQQNGESGIF
ncbi:putative membrane protein YddG [Bacillus cereus]|nr:putative membrane protein YddG [Bacillus cereus]